MSIGAVYHRFICPCPTHFPLAVSCPVSPAAGNTQTICPVTVACIGHKGFLQKVKSVLAFFFLVPGISEVCYLSLFFLIILSPTLCGPGNGHDLKGERKRIVSRSVQFKQDRAQGYNE